MLTQLKSRFTNRRSGGATIAFRDPLRRAFGMDAFAGPETQRLTCINAGSAEVCTTTAPARVQHTVYNGGKTLMHAKPWYRATLLAASFLMAGAGGTVFGDEPSAGVTILRGTPPVVRQPERPPQEVQMRPALPSCPDGYVWNLLLGGCYRPRDPLNPSGY
jgi:hypothetical protein